MAILLKKGCRGKDVKTLQRLLHLYDDGIFGDLTEEAVKQYQREHSLVADGIVGEKTWATMLSQSDTLIKSKRNIKEIIVHCTATPEGRPTTIKELTDWHKKRGFSTIGYHYVVMLDGSVSRGRDVNVSGAHCEGHNSFSIGVCYVGGCDKQMKAKDTRTPAQKYALLTLLKKLKVLYPNAKIRGHRDFAKKDCPSFDATSEYKNI